jgi:hypothetical protein
VVQSVLRVHRPTTPHGGGGGGGGCGRKPYHGDAMAPLVQHSWPLSVAHSLLVVHVFWHVVAQKPLQQSSPLIVLQSLDCPHALGHELPMA